MKKKNTMFKIIAIMALVFYVLSWIIPASSISGGTVTSLGLKRVSLYNIVEYPYLAIQFFLQPLLFMLAVGGLYGVLSETGKYRNKLEKIAKSMKGKEIVFLVLTSFILAALSSVFGLNLMLFIFIPALVGIILLMGYNKMTAFLTTFISPLIGVIGSTYGVYITGYINQIAGTTFQTEIVSKIALFVLSFVIYTAFLVKYATKNKNKSEISEEELTVLMGEKKQSKKASWPMFLVMGLLLVLVILGYTDWKSVFDSSFFVDLHTKLTVEFTIGDHAILGYLFNGLTNLGKWYYAEFTAMILIASIILTFVYDLKVDGGLKAFGKGVVSMLKPAALVIFAYVMVLVSAYHPYIVTVTDWIVTLVSKTSGVFGQIVYIFMISIDTILSTVFNVEMLYVVQSTLPLLSSVYADTTNSLAIITQSIYGLTSFVAPTSTMMLLGLSYLGISYKEWLKTSWKLVLELLAVILIIIAVVVFI